MTDWIEWNGGECPVAGNVVIQPRYPDGFEGPPNRACNFCWDFKGDFARIVAYRLVDAPSAATGAVAGTPSALATQIAGTHYKECKIQPVEFSEANKLQYLEGSIVARAARHDKATGKGAEDVRKIIHEAQLLLQLRYGEAA